MHLFHRLSPLSGMAAPHTEPGSSGYELGMLLQSCTSRLMEHLINLCHFYDVFPQKINKIDNVKNTNKKKTKKKHIDQNSYQPMKEIDNWHHKYQWLTWIDFL